MKSINPMGVSLLFVLLLLGGCAGGGTPQQLESPGAAATSTSTASIASKEEAQSPPTPQVPTETGTVEVDVANAVGINLPCRVDFVDFYGSPPRRVEIASGQHTLELPVGDYRCYIHVYDQGVPVLGEILDFTVKAGSTAYVMPNILEGSGGRMGIHGFDSDGDLAIDRVELAHGTDPNDAASMPGRPTLPFNREVVAAGPRWYRGELNAQSVHGIGSESVAELIKRAERAGLDFLAITDRNSVASLQDPGYKSSSVVLIPAMEWGADEMGYALLYGLRTEPDPPTNLNAAQAECLRIQAQGGVFAIARPCVPDAPWK